MTNFTEELRSLTRNQRLSWRELDSVERSAIKQAIDITGVRLGAFVSGRSDYDPLIGSSPGNLIQLYEDNGYTPQSTPIFTDSRYHDFEIITDLNPQTEIILGGDRTDYLIRGSRGETDGTSIFARTDQGLDLVAIVVGYEPSQFQGHLQFRE